MNKKLVNQIEQIVNDDTYSLYDVETRSENKNKILSIYITKKNKEGVNIDDCILINDRLTTYFDENDPYENQYTLEVSSPGIIRKLTKIDHYQDVIGEDIEVKLFAAVEGFESKKFIATLEDVGEDSITLNNVCISLENIAKAITTFDFGGKQ